MYPGPGAPDLGTFVAQMERALVARGHEVERAVLDPRAGGKARYLTLASRAHRAGRRFRPDVIYAHFLVPSGRSPRSRRGRRSSSPPTAATSATSAGFPVSPRPRARRPPRRDRRLRLGYLRRELETRLPEAPGKTEVVSSGVDREQFAVTPPPDGPPRFLCVGALDGAQERRAARGRVRARSARGAHLRGRRSAARAARGPRHVRLLGRVPHDEIPGLLAESHVLCQPSLLEPLGQALLEAMACGRSVVATCIGGPPEFVPPERGRARRSARRRGVGARALGGGYVPAPERGRPRAAAAHDVSARRSRWRRSSPARRGRTPLTRFRARRRRAGRRTGRRRRRRRGARPLRGAHGSGERARREDDREGRVSERRVDDDDADGRPAEPQRRVRRPVTPSATATPAPRDRVSAVWVTARTFGPGTSSPSACTPAIVSSVAQALAISSSGAGRGRRA